MTACAERNRRKLREMMQLSPVRTTLTTPPEACPPFRSCSKIKQQQEEERGRTTTIFSLLFEGLFFFIVSLFHPSRTRSRFAQIAHLGSPSWICTSNNSILVMPLHPQVHRLCSRQNPLVFFSSPLHFPLPWTVDTVYPPHST
jgi:hypothetical protein